MAYDEIAMNKSNVFSGVSSLRKDDLRSGKPKTQGAEANQERSNINAAQIKELNMNRETLQNILTRDLRIKFPG